MELKHTRPVVFVFFIIFTVMALSLFFTTAMAYEVEYTDESPEVESVENPAENGAENNNKVFLDADSVAFDDASGVATAEGNVRVRNKEMRLFAPYLEYDTNAQEVMAHSNPDTDEVTLVSGNRRLTGNKLTYNVTSGRGVLTDASGRMDALYVKGSSIEVMPLKDVVSKSALNRLEKRGASSDDLATIWSEAEMTTCNEPIPHYKLVAKHITIIPNQRVIVKNPKVYMGKRLLFSYPFDFVVQTGAGGSKSRNSLFPRVGYDQGKGAGIGAGGTYAWESGDLGLDLIWWSQGIVEGSASLEQRIFTGLTVYGEAKREYDKDTRDIRMRPEWGMRYQRNGWDWNLRWSQNELVTVEKDSGRDTRYVIWREPELSFKSPWITDRAIGGHYRFAGAWGEYTDVTSGTAPTYERLVGGIELYNEFNVGSTPFWGRFRPFYHVYYWYMSYDDTKNDEQQILDSTIGVRWSIGDVGLVTSYVNRMVWGASPMGWDDYFPKRELYQEVNMTFPGYRDDKWLVSVRGAYSFTYDELSEMVYKVGYDHHCLLWEAMYRDDMHADDDWFGLKLTIKAYPESKVDILGNELYDPAERPSDLPK